MSVVQVRLAGTDCYEGTGGDPLLPEPFSDSVGLTECKEACLGESQCVAIVRKRSEGIGKGACYRRTRVRLEECDQDSEWDLYQFDNSTTGRSSNISCTFPL